MSWMLDTNACIRYLNGRAPKLKDRLEAADPNEILVCSIVKAELFYGASKSNNPDAARAKQERFISRFTSLPFDDDAAKIYGSVRAYLDASGTPIGPNDLLIAAIALSEGITLVTHNVDEFNRVPGLLVEDWEI